VPFPVDGPSEPNLYLQRFLRYYLLLGQYDVIRHVTFDIAGAISHRCSIVTESVGYLELTNQQTRRITIPRVGCNNVQLVLHTDMFRIKCVKKPTIPGGVFSDHRHHHHDAKRSAEASRRCDRSPERFVLR